MAIEDVRERLASLNLDEVRAQAMADIRSGKKTKREKAIKILRAVDGLQRSGVEPADLIITKVPVIPAGFRPFSVAGESFLPGDANELYADLVRGRDVLNEVTAELGPDSAKELRDYLRNSVRAVYGYGETPNVKMRSRKVSGFFKKIVGGNPKTSFVQGKLISKPQDSVGRAVISPDPSLTIDQVGIPKDMAWEIFKDQVEGQLTSQGIPKARRLLLIKDRHPIAKQALTQQMERIPVVYSRAPAWHRQNAISGYGKIVEGNNIKISPLTTAGLNADFDGDAQVAHIQLLRKKR